MKITFAIALLLVAASAYDDDFWLGEKMQTGFIKVRDDGSDIFYWLVESRNTPSTDPLVFWLSGGPGCSSELAVFYENGPWKINKDLTLTKNEYSWNEQANMVWIDQPIGTGMSNAENPLDMDTNEKEIGQDFYKFLVGFMENHPEYKKRSIFITGESYAGHYIPAISAEVVRQNNPDIVLVGSAIGNGLVDPYNQYPEYLTFAKENKLIGTLGGLVVEAGLAACQGLIKTGIWPVALEECQLSLTPIIGLPVLPAFNLYDIRRKCDVPPLCYDFSNLDSLIAEKKVEEDLNVTSRAANFQDCNMEVHMFLLGDWMTSLQDDVTYLLEQNVNVLVYSGDKDFICNWRGGEKWTHEAQWSKSEEFKNATYQDFNSNDTKAGEFKNVGPLTFLRVFDAGHMVPMDQPEAALTMLDRFFGTWHRERMAELQKVQEITE